MFTNSPTIGITLSGGGAKAIAHIGVLEALEEHNIYPTYVAGASAGAMVGALYAADHPPKTILEIVKDASLYRLFSLRRLTRGLVDSSYLKQIFSEHIKDDNFDGLKKKLFISVSNISKGRGEIISTGKLFDVVVASSSIPIVFSPVKLGNDLYIDGGMYNNLPIQSLKEFCQKIIGVNIHPCNYMESHKLENTISISSRCFELVIWANVQHRLKRCDIVIEPDTSNFGIFDLNKADEIFQVGYETAIEQMDMIKQKLYAPQEKKDMNWKKKLVSWLKK